MKLGKEEIQKLVLGGLMVIGVIYCYFTLLLGPLSRQQAATRKGIEDLGPMIAAAKAQIARTANVERAAPGMRRRNGSCVLVRMQARCVPGLLM